MLNKAMRRVLIMILIIVSMAMFLACVTSQEIIISYPENAGWNFNYYDSSNTNLGDGKANITVNKDNNSFTITLTESAFGDTASFNGVLEPIKRGYPTSFKGEGEWFLGERFNIEGTFNKDFTAIIDGSVAYSVSLGKDIQGLLAEFRSYREDLIVYNQLSSAEKESTETPAKPTNEAYMGSIFTLKAFSQSE